MDSSSNGRTRRQEGRQSERNKDPGPAEQTEQRAAKEGGRRASARGGSISKQGRGKDGRRRQPAAGNAPAEGNG